MVISRSCSNGGSSGRRLTPGAQARAAWPPPAGKAHPVAAEADALRELGRAGGWVTAVDAAGRTVTAVRPAAP